VFSYTPGADADPHANDFSDDEDDVASIAEEDTSTDDDSFEFDNYDVDELQTSRHGRAVNIPPPTPRAALRSSLPIQLPSLSYPTIRMKHRGALLWSSQWFFLNRKMKRILFISIWARARRAGTGVEDDDTLAYTDVMADGELDLSSERFLGWEGGTGAGARALGLAAA
jgi:hypothetical protein